ncbi:hypothetical protein COV11_01640 [Candidatus Woesearchaeota archaeon CG10_big_fil_rev_8_21_14_0_10_30_7]|nr:MAG: hypothetical protein COV11_01640 [Candidatus Woesearchaeota archaeon CG10_big_fil_rev_8_21_14_0_10_30_7]
MENGYAGIFRSKGEKMLKEFISNFTEELPEGHIWKKGRKYFLVDKEHTLKPQYTGIFLGLIGKGFHPSLWLLHWLKSRTKKKLMVDKKGEWMFICGKDIFKSSIKRRFKIGKSDTILVLNQYQECLGYGVFQDRKKVAVKNVFDIGDFLRREKVTKKK